MQNRKAVYRLVYQSAYLQKFKEKPTKNQSEKGDSNNKTKVEGYSIQSDIPNGEDSDDSINISPDRNR